jgi:hypothetical protein
MGIDFQFIAYAGVALPEETLASAIVEHVGIVTLYRYAKVALPGKEDLHCIALYEGPDDRSNTLDFSLPTPESLPEGAPLSAIVQAAWTMARQAARERPAPTVSSQGETELSRLAVLARELSRVVGKVHWVSQGDHACVGGYALFENGRLVDPASEEEVYVDGERYVDVPVKKWLSGTGTGIVPSDVFFQAFPEIGEPPLRVATEPAKRIAFDPIEFEVSLE